MSKKKNVTPYIRFALHAADLKYIFSVSLLFFCWFRFHRISFSFKPVVRINSNTPVHKLLNTKGFMDAQLNEMADGDGTTRERIEGASFGKVLRGCKG